MIPVETLNVWGEQWASLAIRSVVDAAFVLGVVAVVWLLVRRRASPQVGYGLFLLVILKLVVPVPIALPAWAAYLNPRYAIEQLAAAPLDTNAPLTPAPPLAALSPHDAAAWPADRAASPERAAAAPLRGADAALAPGTLDTPLSNPARWMLAWAGVVLLMLLRFVWVQGATQRKLAGCSAIDPRTLPLDLDALRSAVRLRRPVHLLACPNVASPAAWGLFKLRLIVPPDLPSRVNPSQLQWIILHELAHFRRRDLWVATLQRLVQIVYFFNPAVWIANWMIDQQREYACDDLALATCTGSRRDCGEGFLRVVEHAGGVVHPMAAALGLFSGRSFIRKRLMRILDVRRKLESSLSLKALVLLVVLAAIVLPNIRFDSSSASAGATSSTDPSVDAARDRREANTIQSDGSTKYAELNYGQSVIAGIGNKTASGFTLLLVRADDQATSIAISFPLKSSSEKPTDYRVLAVDKAGNFHEPASTMSAAGSGEDLSIVTLVPTFNLHTRDIRSFVIKRAMP